MQVNYYVKVKRENRRKYQLRDKVKHGKLDRKPFGPRLAAELKTKRSVRRQIKDALYQAERGVNIENVDLNLDFYTDSWYWD